MNESAEQGTESDDASLIIEEVVSGPGVDFADIVTFYNAKFSYNDSSTEPAPTSSNFSESSDSTTYTITRQTSSTSTSSTTTTPYTPPYFMMNRLFSTSFATNELKFNSYRSIQVDNDGYLLAYGKLHDQVSC